MLLDVLNLMLILLKHLMQNKVHLLVFQWRRTVEEAGGVDNDLHGHRQSVKTRNPKKYCVRPNTGHVCPRSTCDVIAPPDMQCKDKFLLLSVAVSQGITPKDITPEMVTRQITNSDDKSSEVS
ncbi:putative major sperm protein (MSP) [Helianthus anomalus]